MMFIAAGAAQYLGKYGIVPSDFVLPEGWRRHAQIVAKEVAKGLVSA